MSATEVLRVLILRDFAAKQRYALSSLMEPDFVDIRIVSLEDDMMVVSPKDLSLFYVYLKLSATPPPLWQHHFKNARKVSRHPHWREAWIDRKFIIVECLTDELEKYHLNDLRQDIAYANKLYREHVRLQSHAERQQEKAQASEREKLRDLKDRLNFD